MTQTIYGWAVVKQDGAVAVNARAHNSLAIFNDRDEAKDVAATVDGSRVIPCTLQYEV